MLLYDGVIQPRVILPLNSLFWRRDRVDNWGNVFAGMYTRRYMPAANNAIHQPSQPDKSDLFGGLHKVQNCPLAQIPLIEFMSRLLVPRSLRVLLLKTMKIPYSGQGVYTNYFLPSGCTKQIFLMGSLTCKSLLSGHTQLKGSHKDRVVFICCCREAGWKLRCQGWAGMSAEGKQDLDDYLTILTCVVIVLFNTNMFAFWVSVCAAE